MRVQPAVVDADPTRAWADHAWSFTVDAQHYFARRLRLRLRAAASMSQLRSKHTRSASPQLSQIGVRES